MKKLLIVTRETYLRQVKSLSFLMMVLAPFIMLGFGALGGLIGATAAAGQGNKGLVSTELALVDRLADLGYDQTFASQDQAQSALEAEELASYLQLVVEDGILQVTYHGQENLAISEQLELNQVLSAYQEELNRQSAQLSSDQVSIMARTHILEEVILEDKQWEKVGQQISYFLLVFALYILLITYSAITAQEVANEKGTKIMEVIFSSIPATYYFYGKLLGILGVIVTHVAIYVVGGLLAYPLLQGQLHRFGGEAIVSSVFANLHLSILLFIVLGLFLYVTLAALLGSLVNRLEDVQKAISPLMTAIMIGFFGAMYLGQLGYDHLIIKIGSFIPFLSTFFMPIRVINGYAGNLEAWLSLLISAGTVVGMILAIGRSYAGLILQTDDLGLWQSFKRGLANR